ncbi:rhomboid family intramembrane serine protease [Planctomycetota bacterium]
MGSSVATTRLEGLGAGRRAPAARSDAMTLQNPFSGYRLHFPRWSPAVRAIIIANIAVFVLQVIVVSATGKGVLTQAFGVWPTLVFGRGYLWQPITYMFLHGGPFHILMNMFGLYLVGTQVEHRLGLRRFLVVYFGGGILGGLAHCLMPVFGKGAAPAVGASGAVLAVLVVCAIYLPRQKLLIVLVPVPVRWLAIVLVGVNVLYAVTGSRGIAFMAHLGGMLFGFLYWRLSPVAARLAHRLEDRRREQEIKRRADDERRLDEILAKIGREGLQSLSFRERAELEAIRQRKQQRGYRG